MARSKPSRETRIRRRLRELEDELIPGPPELCCACLAMVPVPLGLPLDQYPDLPCPECGAPKYGVTDEVLEEERIEEEAWSRWQGRRRRKPGGVDRAIAHMAVDARNGRARRTDAEYARLAEVARETLSRSEKWRDARVRVDETIRSGAQRTPCKAHRDRRTGRTDYGPRLSPGRSHTQ